MATLREQLQAASFRGVPFLVESETVNRGKKTATHEYPNSDKRFTEDLGKLPPKFTLDALIHGEDALQQRGQLEEALEQPGLGDLVHPVYGTVQVKSTTFSVTSNQRSIGEFRFSINFETSEPVVSASPVTPSNEQTVTKNVSDARQNILDGIEDFYQNPESALNLTDAADKLSDMYDSLEGAMSVAIDTITQPVADFNRAVNVARDNVFKTAQFAADVKSDLANTFGNALLIVTDPASLFTSWDGLLDFDIDAVVGPTNTVRRIEKEINSGILNEFTRFTALVNAYEAAVYTEFTTIDELNEVQSNLDSRYQEFLIDDPSEYKDAGIKSLAEIEDIFNSIAVVRNSATEVFNTKEQTLWRSTTISPGNTSMSLTAFRYYGTLDNLDQLIALNPSVNVANFKVSDIQAVSR
jgi:prophage DNA circulation protein